MATDSVEDLQERFDRLVREAAMVLSEMRGDHPLAATDVLLVADVEGREGPGAVYVDVTDGTYPHHAIGLVEVARKWVDSVLEAAGDVEDDL